MTSERGPLGHVDRLSRQLRPIAAVRDAARAAARRDRHCRGSCRSKGADVWTAFELTWLDGNGKPRIAIVTFEVPATSPAIVESKSVKLYLGSFAQSRFADSEEVATAVARDLSRATGGGLRVELTPPARSRAFASRSCPAKAWTTCRSRPTAMKRTRPASCRAAGEAVTETLRTDLFRSVCPVTGPAGLRVASPSPIAGHASIGGRCCAISFPIAGIAGFHEHCVERIFVDVCDGCAAASRSRSTRASPAAADSTSTRFAAMPAAAPAPTCARRGNDSNNRPAGRC